MFPAGSECLDATALARLIGALGRPDQDVNDSVRIDRILVLDVDALVSGGDQPAHVDGYGPIPAQAARDLIDRPSSGTPRWLRRLFIRPDSGELIAMESRRRLFTPAQRHYLRLRDQTCRTPYCDAPIVHADHIHGAECGGRTSLRNGQGSCQACNHAKQAPGWQARPGPHQQAEITTPTGHRYHSRPPDPPGTRARPSPVEQRLAPLLESSA